MHDHDDDPETGTTGPSGSGVPGTTALPPGTRALRTAVIIGLLGAVALGVAGVRGALGGAEDARPSDIVDTQQGGPEARHAGFRRAHARGLCVEGRFIGSGEAQGLSVAQAFGTTESRLLGRLSIGGGNPTAPEASAGVRSLALMLTQADGQQWRMAMNTPPVLPVGTPEAFHAQIKALAPDPRTGAPDPDRLAAFFQAHPESAAFRTWQAGHRPSDSWANTRYHSINAFVLVDAAGRRQPVRWALVPQQPFAPLADTDHAADALSVEFEQRLREGPVRWTLQLQLAEAGDAVEDPSRPWPDSRPTVDAGVVEIDLAYSQQYGACNGINFDPTVLPRGIEASADPILHARRGAYAESLRRRARETLLGATP